MVLADEDDQDSAARSATSRRTTVSGADLADGGGRWREVGVVGERPRRGWGSSGRESGGRTATHFVRHHTIDVPGEVLLVVVAIPSPHGRKHLTGDNAI